MEAKPTYEELERRIQELEKNESELEYSREMLRVYEKASLGYQSLDDNGRYIAVNQTWLDTLGYAQEEVIGKSFADFIHPDWRDHFKENFPRFKSLGEVLGVEFAMVKKNGDLIQVSLTGNISRNKKGDFQQTHCIFHDITERKRAEEALREKTLFLQNIIDTTSDLVSVTDMEGNFKFIGSSHTILGYDPDSLVGSNVMDLVHPDDYQEIAIVFADFLANREDVRKVEYRYRRAGGDYIWLETVGKFMLDDAGNPKEILFTSRDVTARRQAEGELKRIEWMLSREPVSDNDAQEKTHDQGYGDLTELNRDGIILKSIGHERLKSFANDYLELLGTSSAIYEVNGDYAFGIFASGWCRMMDRASRKLCDTPDNVDALNSGRWLCHESCWTDCSQEAIATRAPVDIECKGGIRLYAVPIFAGENVIGVINFGYGDPPKDPEKLKMLADVCHLNHDDLLSEATAYDSRPPYIIAMAKKRLNSTAKLIGSMVETKQAMGALRESEERFRVLHNASFGGIAIHDQGVILECNQGLSEISGFGYNEIIGMDGLLLIAELSREAVMHNINSGYEQPYEAIGLRKNGEEYPLRLEARNIPYKGKMVRVVEFRDITERKRQEALLVERERLEFVIDGSSLGTWAWNVQTNETIFNETWAAMFGYTLEELTPTDFETWIALIHPEDLKKAEALLALCLTGKKRDFTCELRMKHKDGHWVWILDRGRIMTWDDTGKPLSMFGTHDDISDRKDHEQQLAAALSEKEVLLREVHHRVKNNLAGIISLIDMQRRTLKDPNAQIILTELSNRIRSMNLVHEKLYRADSLATIDFQGYSQALISHLRTSFGSPGIICRVDAPGITIPLDLASPCGLIVNELITNALKYAFPDGKPRPGNTDCQILVRLQRDKDTYTLTVADNGIGWPAGFDWPETRTLGLTLVRMLGQHQLGGHYVVDQENGTSITLTFTYKEKEAPARG